MPGFFNKPDSSNNIPDNQVQIKKDIYKPKFSHNDELGTLVTKGTGTTTVKTTVNYSVIPNTNTTTTTTSTTTTTTTGQVRQSGEITLQNDSSYDIQKIYTAGTTSNISFTSSVASHTSDSVILDPIGGDNVGYSILVSATYSLKLGPNINDGQFITSGSTILGEITAQEADAIYQAYATSTFIIGDEITIPVTGVVIINNNSSYNLNVFDERNSTSNYYTASIGQTFTYSRYSDTQLVRFYGTFGAGPVFNSVYGVQVTFEDDNQWRPFVNSHNNLDYSFTYQQNGVTAFNGFNTVGNLVFDVVDYDVNSYPSNFSLDLQTTQGIITSSTVENFINDNPSVLIAMNDFWYDGAFGGTVSISAVSRQGTIKYIMENFNTGDDLYVSVNNANPVIVSNNDSQNFYTLPTPINIVAYPPTTTTTSTTTTTTTIQVNYVPVIINFTNNLTNYQAESSGQSAHQVYMIVEGSQIGNPMGPGVSEFVVSLKDNNTSTINFTIPSSIQNVSPKTLTVYGGNIYSGITTLTSNNALGFDFAIPLPGNGQIVYVTLGDDTDNATPLLVDNQTTPVAWWTYSDQLVATLSGSDNKVFSSLPREIRYLPSDYSNLAIGFSSNFMPYINVYKSNNGIETFVGTNYNDHYGATLTVPLVQGDKIILRDYLGDPDNYVMRVRDIRTVYTDPITLAHAPGDDTLLLAEITTTPGLTAYFNGVPSQTLQVLVDHRLGTFGLTGIGSLSGLWNNQILLPQDTPEYLHTTSYYNGTFICNDDGANVSLYRTVYPSGLDVYQDNLYIADSPNHRIVRLKTDGTFGKVVFGESGVSGNDLSHLTSPNAVIVKDGFMYIADTSGQRILRTPIGGTAADVVIGNGTSSFDLDKVSYPVVMDVYNDTLYFISGNRAISVASASTVTNATGVLIAGNSDNSLGQGLSELDGPHGIAADSNGVWITDDFNQRVMLFPYGNTVGTMAFGTGQAGQTSQGIYGQDETLVLDAKVIRCANGKAYVSSRDSFIVIEITPGNTTGKVIVEGTDQQQDITNVTGTNRPFALAVDGDNIYVADNTNDFRVNLFDRLGRRDMLIQDAVVLPPVDILISNNTTSTINYIVYGSPIYGSTGSTGSISNNGGMDTNPIPYDGSVMFVSGSYDTFSVLDTESNEILGTASCSPNDTIITLDYITSSNHPKITINSISSQSLSTNIKFDTVTYDKITNMVTTSQGIKLTNDNAKSLVSYILEVEANGGCDNCNKQLGGYSVNKVNSEYASVSCHNLKISELKDLKVSANW